MPDCARCNRPITLHTNRRCKKCGACESCCRCEKHDWFSPHDPEIGLAEFGQLEE